MDALGLSYSNSLTVSCSNFSKENFTTLAKRSHCLTVSELHFLKLKHSRRTSRLNCSIQMQSDEEEYELKQVKDMAAAKKRWDSMIRDGKVQVLLPREAGYAIQLSNTTLIDVRPSTERTKAWVKNSTWVPIFDVDNTFDAGAISRKVTSFMMGGWWSGVPTLSYNSKFLPEVEAKFPKDTDLIVSCQKGLRSLAACELLYNAGYRNLLWIQGGFEAAEEEDLIREGPEPLKFAGIGGLSEFLGWTDQQRAAAAREGWGYRLVFSARLDWCLPRRRCDVSRCSAIGSIYTGLTPSLNELRENIERDGNVLIC